MPMIITRTMAESASRLRRKEGKLSNALETKLVLPCIAMASGVVSYEALGCFLSRCVMVNNYGLMLINVPPWPPFYFFFLLRRRCPDIRPHGPRTAGAPSQR